MSRRRKVGVGLAAAAAAVAVFIVLRPAALETRYNGAYRLEDGRLVFVTALEGAALSWTTLGGERGRLTSAGDGEYRLPPGQVIFEPQGLVWRQPGAPSERAARVPLADVQFSFVSDGLTLRGHLVLPLGTPPFPAVVIAQGSEEDSAVDTYFEPYLFASLGIAAVTYDKRGTGASEGRYTQYFPTLARDLSQAVAWVRTRPEIDAARIHLAGYSQGGWVAPLAAVQDGQIRSLLINYGPVVSVVEEDRWGYVFALREKGFGDDAVREVDRINATLARIVDHDEDRWGDLARQMEKARQAPWYGAVKGSDSMIGFIEEADRPIWMLRLYAWWKLKFRRREPFVDRLYDPVPTLRSLPRVPSMWIFGGMDHSIPTQASLEQLEKLRAEGMPIQTRVFPQADHGITRAGRYEPGYFEAQVNWLREQSSLAPTSPAGPTRTPGGSASTPGPATAAGSSTSSPGPGAR